MRDSSLRPIVSGRPPACVRASIRVDRSRDCKIAHSSRACLFAGLFACWLAARFVCLFVRQKPSRPPLESSIPSDWPLAIINLDEFGRATRSFVLLHPLMPIEPESLSQARLVSHFGAKMPSAEEQAARTDRTLNLIRLIIIITNTHTHTHERMNELTQPRLSDPFDDGWRVSIIIAILIIIRMPIGSQ